MLNCVPVIVIFVPAVPCLGEIDVTEPIVHGVKRNWSESEDGIACEHELGSIAVLEEHGDVGTDAKYY